MIGESAAGMGARGGPSGTGRGGDVPGVRTTSVSWWRIASHALTLVGAIVAAFYWWQLTAAGSYGWDLGIYYRVRLDDLYGGWVVGGPDAFQYAPAFAQAVAVVRTFVPFDLLLALWRAADLAIVVYLAGPLTLPVLFWGPVASEVNAGNVNLFLALAVALGLRDGPRWSASWAFVLLTKITPAVGLLWFAFRRGWRSIGMALGVTVAVSAISFVLAPTQWVAWLSLIAGHSGDQVVTFPYFVPLAVRLPLAALVVVVAARLGWRWLVPIAAMVAAPVLYFPTQAIAIGSLPSARRAAGSLLATVRESRRGAPTTEAPRKGAEVPAQVVR